MQKLDLRNNLHQIIIGLKSKEIITLLDNQVLNANELLTLIIESKGAFDKNTIDSDKIAIFSQFDIAQVYTTEFTAKLVRFVSTLGNQNRNRTELLGDNTVNLFYSNHKTLVATFNIFEKLLLIESDLFDEQMNFDIDLAQNKGNLTLQVIDENYVSLKKIKVILEKLEQLIETVYLLYDKIEDLKFSDIPVISMIDSGSDININIKLPKEATKLIAQIMKEFWDILSNKKSYRHKQKLSDVENSLTVMTKITEASSKGIIGPEMAQILKNGIFENTMGIILENTLPKEIVLETKEWSNRQLLLEQTKINLLEQGEINIEENDFLENKE